MNNRIQSGVTPKISIRRDGRAAYRHFYEPKPVSQAFVFDAPLALTDRARLPSEHHAFAVAANAIREEEKARFARELHDELAQSLTALKMDTLWVRENAAGGLEAVGEKLGDMVALLDRTVAATRRMASDLRPMLLDDLGLIPAIEWLVSSFTQRCGVACRLCVADAMKLELPEPYATAVFRIAQESLANVAKHAAASQVEVGLDKVGCTVVLVVQDNGCGFLATSRRKPESLGLMGLRERVQLLDGHVLIKSAPGKGTRIEVSIPVQQTRAF